MNKELPEIKEIDEEGEILDSLPPVIPSKQNEPSDLEEIPNKTPKIRYSLNFAPSLSFPPTSLNLSVIPSTEHWLSPKWSYKGNR